ncbi:MAG: hypothetical protein AB7V43_23280 [Acidimicrobiia bacterium]
MGVLDRWAEREQKRTESESRGEPPRRAYRLLIAIAFSGFAAMLWIARIALDPTSGIPLAGIMLSVVGLTALFRAIARRREDAYRTDDPSSDSDA